MNSHRCSTCGMTHATPRYQATPSDEPPPIAWAATLRDLGCGVLALGGLVVLLWAFFLLWPE